MVELELTKLPPIPHLTKAPKDLLRWYLAIVCQTIESISMRCAKNLKTLNSVNFNALDRIRWKCAKY